ncbi:hypothetical protein RhiirA1_397812 [Rhizophagus irregularis]|uniref:Uncharacterized protein n=1 Tax=Rhizophagus irregularis TaxID=588596 RepID=A0A2N0RFX7_9GLOM|nr:hypothetical protein RhiirA1_397812 [Rhizophagus irregularis]
MTMKKIIRKPSLIRDVTRSDEKGAIEANREETLRCCFYAREFKRMYKDFMDSNKVGEKKAKGQIQTIIDHFTENPNMEFIDDSEDEEQEDDQNNVLEVQVNLLNSAKAIASNA